jgi:hypothetical protein
LWLTACCLCGAEQVLAEYDWRQLADSGQVTAGSPALVEGKSALKISNPNDTPLQAQILKIAKPAVAKMSYAIVGEIKYEGIAGDGYLEMWNYFPPVKAGMPEGSYFSRTLGVSGEMGKITGTSQWRRFMLPFDRTGASGPPTRLEMNLFLPGRGTVYLGPVKLVEYPGSFMEGQNAVGNAWWSDRTSGWIGGIGGATLGSLGSLLAWLASRGKSRSFVLVTSIALVVVGVMATLAGIIALAMRQPYGVWFLLLLVGVLLLGIFTFRLQNYQKQYAELELRRMAAIDAHG